ncbi:MAG: hypothetical protein EPN53_05020 [Acidobacteria bacterium]|nr:MAG: hypothetical protein EPN53_05020 [Acidobacteriota bacterium]
MPDPAVPRGPAGAVSPDPGPRAPDPGLSDHGPRTTDHASPDEPPPFGGSWNALYAAVAGTLLTLIALFAAFTRAFE